MFPRPWAGGKIWASNQGCPQEGGDQGVSPRHSGRKPAGSRASSPASCVHDYEFDADLEAWVCAKCGKLLDLMVQEGRHECGPDCEKHSDISAIG